MQNYMVTLRIGFHFTHVNFYLKMYSLRTYNLKLGFSTATYDTSLYQCRHTHREIYIYICQRGMTIVKTDVIILNNFK